MEEGAERGAELGEGDLAVGVAEARVELDDARALGGQGQADVEGAHERGAPMAHLVDRRLGDPFDHQVREVGGGPVERRVRAHAAGVRTLVAVADALEVLGGGKGEDRGAVGDAEDGGFGAVEVLLDDDAAARFGQAGGGVGPGLVEVVGDDDTLAGGEPVVLDDVRRAEVVECVVDLLGRGADVGARRGDVGRGHDLLGERLAALQLGGGGGRPEDEEPGVAQDVGHAGDEGGFRADDDEVDGEAVRDGEDRVGVVTSGSGSQRAITSMPGLPGAATTASTASSAASALASACSRAPEPRTRTTQPATTTTLGRTRRSVSQPSTAPNRQAMCSRPGAARPARGPSGAVMRGAVLPVEPGAARPARGPSGGRKAGRGAPGGARGGATWLRPLGAEKRGAVLPGGRGDNHREHRASRSAPLGGGPAASGQCRSQPTRPTMANKRGLVKRSTVGVESVAELRQQLGACSGEWRAVQCRTYRK